MSGWNNGMGQEQGAVHDWRNDLGEEKRATVRAWAAQKLRETFSSSSPQLEEVGAHELDLARLLSMFCHLLILFVRFKLFFTSLVWFLVRLGMFTLGPKRRITLITSLALVLDVLILMTGNPESSSKTRREYSSEGEECR